MAPLLLTVNKAVNKRDFGGRSGSLDQRLQLQDCAALEDCAWNHTSFEAWAGECDEVVNTNR
jgi:hypothetical protein